MSFATASAASLAKHRDIIDHGRDLLRRCTADIKVSLLLLQRGIQLLFSLLSSYSSSRTFSTSL
jgi:hypothetical protein